MKTQNYLNPNFDESYTRDWREYINEDLQSIWNTFTDEQKLVIANNAQYLLEEALSMDYPGEYDD